MQYMDQLITHLMLWIPPVCIFVTS
jgi:hypothetical protein